jgi:ComF family protein
MSIFDTLIAKIAPHDCLGCGAEGDLLCAACLKRLPPAKEQPPNPENHLDGVRSAALYQGVAKTLVWQLKSAGVQSAAGLMASKMKQLVTDCSEVIIVPVPTAASRVRQRGYNQAALLARALARQARLPCVDCLARHGQAHQVGATRAERLRQLNGALRVTKQSVIKNAHIILVDDVVTTGATLEAAAAVLKAAGARHVEAVTFAQAERLFP